jgi:plastocyanin
VKIALSATLAAAFLFAAPTPATVYPARVQVTAKEFFYALSRGSVVAGPAIVELVNYGEDPHDLRLQRIGARHIAGTPEVQPGAYYDLNVKLVPGKYRLWCSVANHRQLGMSATLVVR